MAPSARYSYNQHYYGYAAVVPPKARTMRLPVELFAPIMAYLPLRDLLSFSLVCRAARLEAERVLYHTVRLLHSPRSLISFCDTLASRPQRIAHVRSLEINAALVAHPGQAYLLRNTLHQLANLTSLSVTNSNRLPPNFVPQFLSPRCRFRLQKFRWAFAIDRELIDFLVAQPYITDLALEQFFPAHLQLPAGALPYLSVLEGDDSVIDRLAPGRPVTRIHFHYNGNLPSQGASRVRTVNVTVDPHVGVGFLAPLVKSFPKLQVLGIVTLGMVHTSSFWALLSQWHHLHSIVVCMRDPNNNTPQAHAAKSYLMQASYTSCPSLQAIVHLGPCRSATRWFRDRSGWKRDEAVGFYEERPRAWYDYEMARSR